MLPLSQQNENGIQAQEMWQLSQYLQVNVKQYIMFDQCVLIICHSWVDKWNFHAKKKVTCLVVILMIKFNFSLPLFFVWQDALYREQMLENKLANLQRLISDSKGAVEDNTQVVAYGIGVCFFRMSWWLCLTCILYSEFWSCMDMHLWFFPFQSFAQEDKLLSRLEILENQLETLTKVKYGALCVHNKHLTYEH